MTHFLCIYVGLGLNVGQREYIKNQRLTPAVLISRK